MLFILIPTTWLALLSLLAAICRVAAEGDAGPAAPGRPKGDLIGIGLVLSRDASTPPARPRRWQARGTPVQRHVASRTRRFAARDLRQR
jgi:hypothetical protein